MQHKLESLESRRLLAGTAAISGSVYTDLNANARHEAGEAGMKAVRVYLDANNNGAWDSRTEASVLTDKRGQFRFDGVAAGTHRLREVTPEGYRIAGPRSEWFRITLTEGQHIARRQFANAPRATSNSGAGGGGSFGGDFDYNGVVEFDDYSLIDLAFNTQAGTLHRAISYLEGSDRSSNGMDTPALQAVQQHFAQFGQDYANGFLNNQPPIVTAKEQAIIDVALNKSNRTLSNAISWLSGNKNVARSTGVQAVIEGYQKFGIDYKRAFLKYGNS